MNMRLKSSFLILFATITVFFVVAVFLKSEQPAPTSPSVIGTQSVSVKPIPEKNKYIYLAKTHEGNLALFEPNDSVKPSKISDIIVSTLPTADIALLENGIEIYTQEQLSHLMEDYGS